MVYLMGRSLRSRSLAICSLVFGVLIAGQLCAQEFSLQASVEISTPDLLTSDKSGSVYVADNKGNLYKYSALLNNEPLVYSPSRPSRIGQIDAWMGLRILIFYKDIQEFTLVNRFLDAPANYTINSPEIRFALAAALSFDNKLWVIDQPSMSLYKYDYQNLQVEMRRPLDMILKKPLREIAVFREYQNRIYIVDKAGATYVFDNLGNFLFEKMLPAVDWVRFSGNELYYIRDGQLVFLNLYSFQESRDPAPLPAVGDSKYVIYGEERLYVLTGNSLQLYSLPK